MLPLLISLLLQSGPPQSETRFVHENPGFELALPSAQWVERDQGKPGIFLCLISPDADLKTHCTILHYPKLFLSGGLAAREEQVKVTVGKRYQRIGMGPGKIAGRSATQWQYQVGASTIFEWAFEDADTWVVFQISAPEAAWNDAVQKRALERLRDSFVWRGGAAPANVPFDATPPARVHASRAAGTSGGERPFAVSRHQIAAKLEPAAHSLDVTDTLTVEARRDGVQTISLHSTVVTIDRVTSDAQFHWRVDKYPNVNVLFIELEQPLAAHASVTFVVHESCADYFFAVDQQQVREISVLGQIRAESSFSSHVDWYPIEEWNDAAVEITFDVPEEYVALTGGELVGDAAQGERHVYHYSETRRTRRQLPFGFAVGAYVSRSGKSDGGLRYSVWGFAGEEPLLEQRLPILGQAVAAYERAFGPLAWNDVRFVHVRPERKEAGVSLPGMILLSDGYFADVTGVDLSDGNIDSGTGLSVLVLADELSHQWNFYASSFPNELAEGIAEYTDALFVENRHGAAAYRRAIHFNRDAWIVTAGAETEFAVANPSVSSNSRYRAVVFSKTPVVLHALRVLLGDEVFFEGMRGAFAIAELDVDGFARLQHGFSAAAGRDLRPFFEQWFFRAGFPTLHCEHAATNGGVRVTLRQTQTEAPYELQVPVQLECEDGSTQRFTADLREREQTFEIPLPSPAKSVTVDPDGTLPARVGG